MSQLLTLKEAAARMTLSWQTVRRLVHAGKVGHLRLGDGPKAPIRIASEDVDRYLATRHVEAFQEPAHRPARRAVANNLFR